MCQENSKIAADIKWYSEKHVMPWLIEHIKLRALGFQIFSAIQGALAVAAANLMNDNQETLWPIAAIGLSSCISFWIWDKRNRFVFRFIHKLLNEEIEKKMFTPTMQGIHGLTMNLQGEHEKRLGLPTFGEVGSYQSHTMAMKIVNLACVFMWISIIVGVAL